ncbi:MAG: MFS transporter [Gammaproteobacteria bacterium]
MIISPPGAQLGIFQLGPGVTRANAITLLFGAVSTLALVTFISFAQPYLFAILGIPANEQGSLTGQLVTAQEATQVLIAGAIGALSDRHGRRLVYVIGLVWMALGFVIYPLAESSSGLLVFRIFYAIGMTAATVMMSTCFAEYTAEATRGRWMGMVGVFNGLGVVLMAVLLAKTPLWLGQLGLDDVAAIRYSFWIFATYMLVLAVVLRLGLQGLQQRSNRSGLTLLQQTRIGLAVARQNPRIGLAYLLAFASRGDLVIITTFISLWIIQAGIQAGMTPGAATARAGMIFGTAQGVALIWSFVMGWILDRFTRLTGVCLAFAFAAIGYSALGQVSDPLGPWILPAAMLAGIGEASAVVASAVLIGQEAPSASRGTVIGCFGLCGSLGIMSLTAAGGWVYDSISAQSPFIMMGLVNFVVLLIAIRVRHRYPAPAIHHAVADGVVAKGVVLDAD